MKLKLERTDKVAILRVSESLSERDFEVLKAGIGNILRGGNRGIVIDLTNLSGVPWDLTADLRELRLAGATLGAQVLVVSPFSGQGDCTSLDAALSELECPTLETLLRIEADLQASVERLESRKAGLARSLASTEDEDRQFRALKRQRGELKELGRQIEDQLHWIRASRRGHAGLEIASRELLERDYAVLSELLASQGILEAER